MYNSKTELTYLSNTAYENTTTNLIDLLVFIKKKGYRFYDINKFVLSNI